MGAAMLPRFENPIETTRHEIVQPQPELPGGEVMPAVRKAMPSAA